MVIPQLSQISEFLISQNPLPVPSPHGYPETSGAGAPPEANWVPLRALGCHCCSSTVERRVFSSHGMQYCPRKVDSLRDEAAGSKQTKASYIRSSQAAGTTTPGIPGRLCAMCLCVFVYVWSKFLTTGHSLTFSECQ